MLLPLHLNLQPLVRSGGAIGDFWLERLEEEAPKKALVIIREVAKREAPRQVFRLAPLRQEFQARAYPFKSDYAEIYRREFEKARAAIVKRLMADDDEVLLLM